VKRKTQATKNSSRAATMPIVEARIPEAELTVPFRGLRGERGEPKRLRLGREWLPHSYVDPNVGMRCAITSPIKEPSLLMFIRSLASMLHGTSPRTTTSRAQISAYPYPLRPTVTRLPGATDINSQTSQFAITRASADRWASLRMFSSHCPEVMV
jgi:hypothetical protein